MNCAPAAQLRSSAAGRCETVDRHDVSDLESNNWRKTMKIAATLALLLLTATSQAFAASGWIERESKNSVEVTVDKLVASIEEAGAKVFATVDHAAGAKSIGQDMAPTVLVIFGNPKLGTPIIQANRRAGLDLPVRVLIWEDQSVVHIGYEAPDSLKARYEVQGADESFAATTKALDRLTTAASE